MITSPQDRIDTLVAAGHWGTDTLHTLLARHAAQRPHALAVRDPANRVELIGTQPAELNWAELAVASDNMAGQLQGAGVHEGDRLVVQLPNILELLVLYYAASKLGVIVSPVPMQYQQHELHHVASTLAATHCVTLETFRDSSPASTVADALPDIQHLLLGKDLTIQRESAAMSYTPSECGANNILTLCWTSGTTGTPKAVPRSHNMWLATGRASVTAGDMRTDDVLLNPFPMVNMAALGGFLFPAALLGSAIVLHHPLDPAVFLQQMQDDKVTFTIAPPALLNQLAKSPAMWNAFDFSALRCVGSGSAPLSPGMIEVFEQDYKKAIINFYGSNEGISLFATPNTAPDPEVRASMFTRPMAGAAIRTRVIDPESGAAVTAPGERGELVIAGATVFDGYYAHDNADVFTAEGEFRSGDLVEISGKEADHYRIVGRSKDIINRGGMKISPVEIDVALEQHPDLAEVAVCAYADERLGEKICACVVLQAEAKPIDLEQLQSYLLAQGFAKFKLPERLEYFASLPRNPLGKVQRFALQDSVADKIATLG